MSSFQLFDENIIYNNNNTDHNDIDHNDEYQFYDTNKRYVIHIYTR